jgi:hypothetical protein
MRRITRRLSPAMTVGVTVLLMVLGGVAFASIPDSHGVIHACYQKQGGVLRVINSAKRGHAGRCGRSEVSLTFNQRGRRGLRGAQGTQGIQGPQGPAGPLTTTLPRGQTLRGWFNFDTVAANAGDINGGNISFGFSLASAPAVQIIPVGGPSTAQCPGSVASPSAASGNLCLYESTLFNVSMVNTCGASACTGTNSSDPFGAEVFVHATAAGRFYVDGTWAVTG